MEMETYENGVPSWVELGAPDPTAAGAFYAGLFGWTVNPGPPEAGGYIVAELNGRSVAGIGSQQNPAPPVWATYINVDDADATAAAITAAGGTVMMPPTDVMDVGRMAIFTDPVGAVCGLWQPGTHTGAGIVNEPGAYSWSELVTTDIPASKAFYGAVFGWDGDTMGGDGPGAYTEWKLGGRPIGGMMAKPPTMPEHVPPHWGVYFAVADTDASVARATELGGSVLMAPMDIEPGRFAVLADPAGASFNVIAMKPVAS